MEFLCLLPVLVVPARFVVAIFFCRTLERVLQLCHPDARRLTPGLVYLSMIPCFHYVWQIVTVVQVAGSLQTEFHDRGLEEEAGDYGRTAGLAFCVLAFVDTPAVAVVDRVAPESEFAPLIVWAVLNVAWFSLLVLYWVQVAGYGRQLADDNERHTELDNDMEERAG